MSTSASTQGEPETRSGGRNLLLVSLEKGRTASVEDGVSSFEEPQAELEEMLD
jgi:hypothetical protein